MQDEQTDEGCARQARLHDEAMVVLPTRNPVAILAAGERPESAAQSPTLGSADRRSASSDSPGRHRVIIVGGGFGGLAAVNGLAGSQVSITLIDQRNYHLFQPLLYQVATASLATSEIAWPIRYL